jgi:hypothetical protein
MTEAEERLAADLRALGRELPEPAVPSDLPEAVLRRIDRPVRVRSRWALPRRRVIAVVVAVLLLALALVPPVRAVIASWLRIGGVLVRTVPAPGASGPPGSSAPSPAGTPVTLEKARRLVAFPFGVPDALGAPDRVTVSADRRVVSMQWPSGPQLDQFDGRLSWVYVKESWRELQPVTVGGRDAVWFPYPHRLVYVDAAGVEHRAEARLTGPVLVWETELPGSPGRPVTVRLEGVPDRDEAIRIGASLR